MPQSSITLLHSNHHQRQKCPEAQFPLTLHAPPQHFTSPAPILPSSQLSHQSIWFHLQVDTKVSSPQWAQ